MPDLSRAQFLSRGARGGVALVAGGSVLALAACGDDDAEPTGATTARDTGTTAAGMVDDTAIAMLAATAELLAIDFYSRVIEAGGVEADVLAYLEAARQNEQNHYDALAGVLGDAAPAGLSFTYPEGTFDSPQTAAETGAALETAFVGAYMGAVTALRDSALKALAARIGANEAQHLTNLNSIAAGGDLVPNPSLPQVLTAREATDAVTPFLA